MRLSDQFRQGSLRDQSAADRPATTLATARFVSAAIFGTKPSPRKIAIMVSVDAFGIGTRRNPLASDWKPARIWRLIRLRSLALRTRFGTAKPTWTGTSRPVSIRGANRYTTRMDPAAADWTSVRLLSKSGLIRRRRLSRADLGSRSTTTCRSACLRRSGSCGPCGGGARALVAHFWRPFGLGSRACWRVFGDWADKYVSSVRQFGIPGIRANLAACPENLGRTTKIRTMQRSSMEFLWFVGRSG